MPTKKRVADPVDELRPEYDLSRLKGKVRGKYFTPATAGVSMVLLESDVAAAFPTGQAVNRALRSVLTAQRKVTLANKTLQPTNRARKSGGSRRSVRAARG